MKNYIYYYILLAILIAITSMPIGAVWAQVTENKQTTVTVTVTTSYNINVSPSSIDFGTVVESDVVQNSAYPVIEITNIGTAACDVAIQTDADTTDHLGNWLLLENASALGTFYYIDLNITTPYAPNNYPTTYEVDWSTASAEPYYSLDRAGFFFIGDASTTEDKFVKFWFITEVNATGPSKVMVDTDRDGSFSDESWAAEGAEINLILPSGWKTANKIYVKDLPPDGAAVNYVHFVGWNDLVGTYDRDLINNLDLDGIVRVNIMMAAPYGMPADSYSATITFVAQPPG